MSPNEIQALECRLHAIGGGTGTSRGQRMVVLQLCRGGQPLNVSLTLDSARFLLRHLPEVLAAVEKIPVSKRCPGEG